MNLKLALLFTLSLLSTPSLALYGGHKVVHDEASQAVVSIHLSDADKPQYSYFCSGVLVTPTRVLTTGHCITRMGDEVYDRWNMFIYEPRVIKVRINGKEHSVRDVNLAPTYAEHYSFQGEDLAAIDLVKTAAVKPLRLARVSDLKAGLKVRMIARGLEASSTIKKIQRFDDNLVVFTQGDKAGVCQGDSGGALLIQKNGENLLAGILSAQEEGCFRMDGVSHFPRLGW